MPPPVTNRPVLTFKTEPSMEQVSFQLAQWGKAPVKWKDVWRDVIKMFYTHEEQLFLTDGRGQATAKWPQWAPLSEREPPKGGYKAYKKKVRPGRKILVFDGKLKSSLTGGAGSRKVVAGQRMMVYIGDSSVRNYARHHAQGVASRNLPARPPVRYEGKITHGTFGYAVAQVVQSHVVLARKKALSKDVENAIDLAGAASLHKRQIKRMVSGAWK